MATTTTDRPTVATTVSGDGGAVEVWLDSDVLGDPSAAWSGSLQSVPCTLPGVFACIVHCRVVTGRGRGLHATRFQQLHRYCIAPERHWASLGAGAPHTISPSQRACKCLCTPRRVGVGCRAEGQLWGLGGGGRTLVARARGLEHRHEARGPPLHAPARAAPAIGAPPGAEVPRTPRRGARRGARAARASPRASPRASRPPRGAPSETAHATSLKRERQPGEGAS